jgi:phosphatidylglycerol---prolipoprotein diacylglyceryl transferase
MAASSLASIGWPVLDRIRIGDTFAISPHGLGIAIGFLIGAVVLSRLAPSRGIAPDHVSTMIFWALVGAVVGARLFYVIAHFSEFANLGQMLAVWRGGISLLGGIAGAVLVNVPLMRRYGYRFFQVMDPAVIALSLGIAIGRIGDLIIGDHLGKPTSWLLAWSYHGGTLAPPYVCRSGRCVADLLNGSQQIVFTRAAATLYGSTGRVLERGVGVHQTALYDLVSATLLFLVLWRMNKRPRREGVLTLTFGIWYGSTRFITDFLRIDKRFFGLTGSQWTAVTVAVLSVAILVWWALRAPRDRAGPGTAVPAEGDSSNRSDDSAESSGDDTAATSRTDPSSDTTATSGGEP